MTDQGSGLREFLLRGNSDHTLLILTRDARRANAIQLEVRDLTTRMLHWRGYLPNGCEVVIVPLTMPDRLLGLRHDGEWWDEGVAEAMTEEIATRLASRRAWRGRDGGFL